MWMRGSGSGRAHPAGLAGDRCFRGRQVDEVSVCGRLPPSLAKAVEFHVSGQPGVARHPLVVLAFSPAQDIADVAQVSVTKVDLAFAGSCRAKLAALKSHIR